MANLSLLECLDSQVDNQPIVNGQLVCCIDSGRFFRDTADERIPLGNSILSVSSLPIAPISNKLYLLRPSTLYFYNGNDWISVNEIPKIIITQNSTTEFPSVGSELALYVCKTENRTYRQDDDNLKYYCVGSNQGDIQVIDGGRSS